MGWWMKIAVAEGYPYVRPCERGVILDVDNPSDEQVEDWVERALYAWGVLAGQEGPRIRLTLEVIGPVRKAN